jgi:hypothetical protein
MLTSLSLALLSSQRAATAEGVLSGKFRGMEQAPPAGETFEPPAVPLSAEEAMLQGGEGEASEPVGQEPAQGDAEEPSPTGQ